MKKLILIAIAIMALTGCGSDCLNGECTKEVKTVTIYEEVPVEVIQYVDRNVTIFRDRNVTQYVDRNVTVIQYVDRNVTQYVDREVIVYVDRNITQYIDRNISIEVPIKTCSILFQGYMDGNNNNTPESREVYRASRYIKNDGIIFEVVLFDAETDKRVFKASLDRKARVLLPLVDGKEYHWYSTRYSDGSVIDDGGTYVTTDKQGDQLHITAEEPFVVDCDNADIQYIRFDPPVDDNGDLL